MLSARQIFETAPLGATISFSDGAPRPPERFNKKLAEWKRSNGTGLLVKKEPSRMIGAHKTSDTFCLNEGAIISQGVTVITFLKHYDVDRSRLGFKIDAIPPAGSVLVVTQFGDTPELVRLCGDVAEARAWLTHERRSNAQLLQVGNDGVSAAVVEKEAA